MFLLYLYTNCVQNAKGSSKSSSGGEPTTGLAMEFTMKELYGIQEIHSEKQLLRLIVS